MEPRSISALPAIIPWATHSGHRLQSTETAASQQPASKNSATAPTLLSTAAILHQLSARRRPIAYKSRRASVLSEGARLMGYATTPMPAASMAIFSNEYEAFRASAERASSAFHFDAYHWQEAVTRASGRRPGKPARPRSRHQPPPLARSATPIARLRIVLIRLRIRRHHRRSQHAMPQHGPARHA